MKNVIRYTAAALIAGACAGAVLAESPRQADAQLSPARTAYPPTKSVDMADAGASQTSPDPYRWLEKDVRQDTEVASWVQAQSAFTRRYLDALPERDAIRARLQKLWNYERYGVPVKRGGRYFFIRNSGLLNQDPLYVQGAADARERLLLDPNTWSKDNANALAEWMPNKDGSKIAYQVQEGGSDWRTIRVLDVASGKPLSDELRWVKFSTIAWMNNGAGFFYSRFAAPPGSSLPPTSLGHAIYFHQIGTAQSADEMIYSAPQDPELIHVADTSADGRWLVITSIRGSSDHNAVHVRDLLHPGSPTRALFPELTHNWSFAGSVGDRLFFKTDMNAPRYRLMAVDITATGSPPREIIPQGAGILSQASLIGGEIVAAYLEDARSVVKRFSLAGDFKRQLPLSSIGAISNLSGRSDDPEAFYSFSSFNLPPTVYRFDVRNGASSVFRRVTSAVDPARYEVKQLFFSSKDGTRVPMFVVHRRDLDISHGAPTMLFGYGGFNTPLTPNFSAARLAWIDMGGVFAFANVRGGGEYGQSWHEAGSLANKQNSFDDFIAAAEFLIRQGITTRKMLAIQGGSNGGLLVGAVVNQRPDLFAVAEPVVGVMDMLRFDQFTAGRMWKIEYGDPADPEDHKRLLSYSPYHNIRSGMTYPAILVATADADDRVVPAHSFKYAAALQAASIGDKPHLIRIETRAGHGSGKPTDKAIEEYTDLWAFAGYYTGLTHDPVGKAPGVR